MNSEKQIFLFLNVLRNLTLTLGRINALHFELSQNQILSNSTSHNLFWYETGIAVAKKGNKTNKRY